MLSQKLYDIQAKIFPCIQKWVYISFTYYQWQKYSSLSYVSNLSYLEMGGGTTKKNSVKSIDRSNTYRFHFVLFSCISFRSQVMKV